MNDTSTPRCRYHEQHSARWHCPACELDLCTDCRPYAEILPIEIDCPLCRSAMLERHAAPALAKRWRELAVMPLHSRSLLLLPALAALVAVVPLLWPRVLLAVPVSIVIAAAMAVIARHEAENRSGSANLRELVDIDGVEYALRTLWFALPFAVAFALAAASGSLALALVAIIATGVLAPAALMATVMNDSADGLFRPELIHKLFAQTRRDYPAVALLGLGATALLALTMMLPGGSPVAIFGGVAAGIGGGWLAAAWGCATGELLYRHRRMLDYAAGADPLDRPRRPAAGVYEPALLVADARILLAERRRKSARRHLGESLTRFPDDLELNRLFDELVRESASREEYRNHLERRIRRLIGRGQAAAAADIWQRNNPYLGNWTPRSSETRYQLALELDQRGEHMVAFRMLIGLSPKNKRFTHMAEAWLEAARILDQHLEDPDKASELRRFVTEHYPERARKWLNKWHAFQRPGAAPETGRTAQPMSH